MYSMVFYPLWLVSSEGESKTTLLRCCLSLSCPDIFCGNADYSKRILSISEILVSFCSQEYLEHKYVYYVFHTNIPNNLECLEHL